MHEFPYTVNSPHGGKVTINDENDLKELLGTFLFDSKGIPRKGETFYSFVKQTICPNRLRDPWAASVVERYFYCEQFKVSPYPGGYDDQPVYWLDISRVIRSTLGEIQNCSCNLHE